jgi:hypothetical protein
VPKSKHRRKPGGKAVAHPGRDKPGRPIRLSWLDELDQASSTSGLPLFDWANPEPAAGTEATAATPPVPES